jgi:hypothetical protein
VTLQPRDRRALSWLAVSVLLMLIWRFAIPSGDTGLVTPQDTVDMAERRLDKLRHIAATVPGKEALLQRVSAELKQRETGLMPGDTAAQAQAQLLSVVQRVAKKQEPPIEIGQDAFAEPQPFGDAYGEVRLSLSFECHMEQVVNFLAALTAQPEAVATSELAIAAANPKQKTVSLRMTVCGLVPRRLVPVRKGLASF